MHLQQEILRQAKDIEQFLGSSEAKHKRSKLFTSLATLCTLFKSELTMNAALRSEIVVERKRRTALENAPQRSYATSLCTISGASQSGIHDLEQWTRFVLRLIRDSKTRPSNLKEFDELRLQFSLDVAQATIHAEKTKELNQELRGRVFASKSELALANTRYHQKRSNPSS
jgi:hypothetical protein